MKLEHEERAGDEKNVSVLCLFSMQHVTVFKILRFCTKLGFEQRNRFRILWEAQRTEKNVLRKPPAGAPVKRQKIKHIYIYIYLSLSIYGFVCFYGGRAGLSTGYDSQV